MLTGSGDAIAGGRTDRYRNAAMIDSSEYIRAPIRRAANTKAIADT